MAQHIHMPMQSGFRTAFPGRDASLEIARNIMRAAPELSRASGCLPDAAIGADVIAGFPGETEEDHQATIEFIERLPLTYVHVFSFSSRPGTAAADLREQVPEQVVARRARELRALGEEKKAAFRAAQVGRTGCEVLTLNRRG